jgi:ribosomal protein L11 methyltransferase
MELPIYHSFSFETDPASAELLLAHLSLFPFESFEETDSGITGYIREEEISGDLRIALRDEFSSLYRQLKEEVIENKNWNEEWESNFNPIQVGSFCGVRATFHEPNLEVRYDLIIDPKMAFGTGHHATTWMMMDRMKNLDFEGNSVLDFGAGTAILSILAEKMGAVEIDAVEIELPAVLNARQNLQLNACQTVHVISGDIDAIPKKKYDIILANINRKVLLESLSSMRQILKESGVVLLSGILEADFDMMATAIGEQGFSIPEVQQKGEWLCLQFDKKSMPS